MITATTQLRDDDAYRHGERDTLLWFLDEYRRVLARKAEGISDEQARQQRCPPSDMTLLGLIRHMADVERGWFRRCAGGHREIPPIFCREAHPDGDEDGDFHPPPDATLAEAFEAYWREIEVADRNIAAIESLDTVFDAHRNRRISLRWILVHMIEEYARHCGHADLLREAIDGATGD
ncbi:MAG: DinB family protein [Acidimicrobiales bacterium]